MTLLRASKRTVVVVAASKWHVLKINFIFKDHIEVDEETCKPQQQQKRAKDSFFLHLNDKLAKTDTNQTKRS